MASTTIGCGPRISQWVQVTDCKQKYVVVPDATVYIYEGITEDMAGGLGSAGLSTQGGDTNAQGNTWGSFPAESGSAVRAYMASDKTLSSKQPTTKVAANPTEPVFVCVNR